MFVLMDTTSESWFCLGQLQSIYNFCIRSSLGRMYKCRAQHRGALLCLPHKGHRKDVIPIKVFKDYIRDNVDNWFRWSKKMKLPVEHMEDLILVTGCTLVTSWAAAAFDAHMPVDESDATTISLEAEKSDNGGAQYFWRNIRGNVEYHNTRFGPVRSLSYVFAVNLCFFRRTSMFKDLYLRTNAYLSGVFVQSALSSGPNECGLQQNPFLTTLTTVGRMKYK